jgi:L-threonylcarbamoyladenylate synthase
MVPRVLPAKAPSSIAEAVALLREGELVAFPTETVYGLGGRALDPAHVARIFAAKGRPSTHPLIAHVPSADEARELCRGGSLGAAGVALAEAFWPGPLTLVVDRAAHVPRELTGGADSVALRVPRHPAALSLLRALGEPLAAPSANRFQSLSPTRAEHVVRSLGGEVRLVLDGGPCREGIESTVVDVRTDIPRVLRQGALSLEMLRRVCPRTALAEPSAPSRDELRASPGLDPKHYAPRARLLLVERAALAESVRRAEDAEGRPVGVLVLGPFDAREGVKVERLPSDAEGYAHGLFAALHRLDDEVATIVVERVPDDVAFDAVRDRLARASHLG